MLKSTQKHLTLSMIIYCLTIIVVSLNKNWINQYSSYGGYVAVGLVMIPVLYMAITLIKGFIKQDEMLSQISLKAIAIAFTVGSLFSISYGLLEAYAGFPSVSGFVYWTVFGGSWGVSGAILNRTMS